MEDWLGTVLEIAFCLVVGAMLAHMIVVLS